MQKKFENPTVDRMETGFYEIIDLNKQITHRTQTTTERAYRRKVEASFWPIWKHFVFDIWWYVYSVVFLCYLVTINSLFSV